VVGVPYWGAEWVNWMAARLRRAREREESMSGKRVERGERERVGGEGRRRRGVARLESDRWTEGMVISTVRKSGKASLV
jgi:hypothetical protein